MGPWQFMRLQLGATPPPPALGVPTHVLPRDRGCFPMGKLRHRVGFPRGKLRHGATKGRSHTVLEDPHPPRVPPPPQLAANLAGGGGVTRSPGIIRGRGEVLAVN